MFGLLAILVHIRLIRCTPDLQISELSQVFKLMTILFKVVLIIAALNLLMFKVLCQRVKLANKISQLHLYYVLTFDPVPKNAIPRLCTRRKWYILMAVMRGNRVGGNWLMKWDEVKSIPWYSHRLTHRKRVTSELHDSYFRLMTIKHSISKIEWASNDYIIELSSTSQ